MHPLEPVLKLYIIMTIASNKIDGHGLRFIYMQRRQPRADTTQGMQLYNPKWLQAI